jgi:hypothetical protein
MNLSIKFYCASLRLFTTSSSFPLSSITLTAICPCPPASKGAREECLTHMKTQSVIVRGLKPCRSIIALPVLSASMVTGSNVSNPSSSTAYRSAVFSSETVPAFPHQAAWGCQIQDDDSSGWFLFRLDWSVLLWACANPSVAYELFLYTGEKVS